MKFVNNYDNFYFSEENDNQQGSVEEQLSILKAIFLGKRTKMLNNLFERQVNTTVGHLNSQFTSKKHYREYRRKSRTRRQAAPRVLQLEFW